MTKTDIFVTTAIEMAKDNAHGYSQIRRWGPDYDCSSLMYFCAEKAGYPINLADPRYTGTMIKDFSKVGYRIDAFDGNLSDLERGDILLNAAYHTAVYIGNGQIVEASSDESGGIKGDRAGDQTGHEIHIRSVYNYPWTHVLTPPKEAEQVHEYKTISSDIYQTDLDTALSRIALACINGDFGNGAARKDAIYNRVQDRVNRLLNS